MNKNLLGIILIVLSLGSFILGYSLWTNSLPNLRSNLDEYLLNYYLDTSKYSFSLLENGGFSYLRINKGDSTLQLYLDNLPSVNAKTFLDDWSKTDQVEGVSQLTPPQNGCKYLEISLGIDKNDMKISINSVYFENENYISVLSGISCQSEVPSNLENQEFVL